MTALGPRPEFDVVPPGLPGRRGQGIPPRAVLAVVASLLSVLARHPASIASVAGPPSGTRAAGTPAHGVRLAQADSVADTTRNSWFRVGDLLTDMMRKLHHEHVDAAQDGADTRPQPVDTPFELGLPSLTGHDERR